MRGGINHGGVVVVPAVVVLSIWIVLLVRTTLSVFGLVSAFLAYGQERWPRRATMRMDHVLYKFVALAVLLLPPG
jgi:hypothetical protein